MIVGEFGPMGTDLPSMLSIPVYLYIYISIYLYICILYTVYLYICICKNKPLRCFRRGCREMLTVLTPQLRPAFM
jgi:Na+/H+-dicarboxylate symporter